MKVVIVGPTGVGKTKLSISLAKYLDAYIINADAVQVYKELNIGSAKVTEEEKENIKHFLFDIKNAGEEYNIKEYQKDLRELLEKFKDKNLVIVGGSGLYISAGLYDYNFNDEEELDLSNISDEELYNMAIRKDKNCNIDKNNRIRLERFVKRNKEEKNGDKLLYDDVIFIGLTINREILYERINKRVDEMFNKGLVEEVKKLKEKYPNSMILKRAIGYKEVVMYLEDKISKEECIELIKKNSRHYAKRQYTWFNNKMNIKWFDVYLDDFNITIDNVLKYINEFNK